MKRQFMAAWMVLAMAGFCGCEEEEETNSGGPNSVAGSWNGTMVVTKFMGQTVAPGDSDVVPFTMNITQSGDYIEVAFQANEYPGFFSGHYYYDVDRSIDFTATADYTYYFFGNVDWGERSMSGAWTVNVPGGMQGTWQASR